MSTTTCDTVRVVPQLLLQLHALLLHLIQLLLQLCHLCMDILDWDELVRLHLRGLLDHITTYKSEWAQKVAFSFIYKLLLNLGTLRLTSGNPCPGAGGLAGRGPLGGLVSDLAAFAFLLNGFSLQNR